jgi:hypothetical protein
MEPTSTAPVEVAVEALATATASPMTATDGDILTLVADLARDRVLSRRAHCGCPGPLGGLGHCHTAPAAG